MNERTVERIAHTHAASLRVVDDADALFQVTVLVEVCMAHACARFDDRH